MSGPGLWDEAFEIFVSVQSVLPLLDYISRGLISFRLFSDRMHVKNAFWEDSGGVIHGQLWAR